MRIPRGVKSIEIRSASGAAAHVTRPVIVEEIVKWFDALPKFVPRPCPYPVRVPPTVTFVFDDREMNAVATAVDRLPGTCAGEIGYGNDLMVAYAPLADDGFVARVSRLLGVRLGSPPTLPAGVRKIKILAHGARFGITNRAKVETIVRWFAELGPVPPGVYHCPAIVSGPAVSLVFLNAKGVVVAEARYVLDFEDRTLVSGPCNPITLDLPGAPARRLLGGRVLLRVQQLLGIRLKKG